MRSRGAEVAILATFPTPGSLVRAHSYAPLPTPALNELDIYHHR
ncbi:hypothetical protein [Scytonema millei]|nr:hypothetical protein [Scytonema millei]